MKTVYWIVAGIVAAAAILLLIAYGRPPSTSEATADFCADLNQYARTLLELRSVDETSTVGELRTAAEAVNTSLEAVQASATDVREARLAALEASQQELQDAIHSIPDDATLAQAQAQLRLGALNALADAVEVMTMDCEVRTPQGATTFPQR